MDYYEKFKQRYANLNEEQKRAVDCIEGPVLVIAGPGSGKTEILSLSVANKLQQTDCLPSSILCLTFTEAAAVNMRKRLAGLIGAEAYKVAIHTFHSFGKEVINQNQEYFYLGASYVAADELVQTQILEEILLELDHNSKLNSRHPSQGYTFLKQILTRIGDLKNGGVSPDQFKQIVEINAEFYSESNELFAEVFGQTISKKLIPIIENLVIALGKSKDCGIKKTIIQSLSIALAQAQSAGNTKALTEWKKKFITKDINKKSILKDSASLDKHLELAKIYQQYQHLLQQRGYFDFSDMILDVIAQADQHPDLKFNLQERYQYILVDEFQDSSGGQMKLLETLIDSEVNEGRPNILVVGDDDQSIYKFQGAKIANIMSFHEKYRDPEVVVLTKNYRSTQNILDLARKVITQSDQRLENQLPEIIKKLSAEGQKGEGTITDKEFMTNLHEFSWIAEEIKKLIATGTSINEIAVIAPKHKILQNLALTLDFFDIPVNYEQKKNLLEQRHIHEIIQIAKFLSSIASTSINQADHYLPEILAFDFLEIDKLDIWKISLQSNKDRKNWLETMLDYPNDKLRALANFLIELGTSKTQLSAEEILDIIIGSSELNGYTSPYKHFYFDLKPEGYIQLLTELESFFSIIRNYQTKAGITLDKFVEFIELNETHNIRINQNTNLSKAVDSVNLMTAHKAKGLEFETVFISSCQDNAWVGRKNSDNLKLPINLNLSPEAETVDDQLRLFYVAITRAKRKIYITHHKFEDDGSEQTKIRFLTQEQSEKSGAVMPQKIKDIKREFAQENELESLIDLRHQISKHKIESLDDKQLLMERLKDYKLSVTHLNNFLNVVDAGPEYFLTQNILRFPQKQSTAGSYGTAVHNALNRLQKEYKKTTKIPSLQFLIYNFDESLKSLRLNQSDYKKLEAKGHEQLEDYYKQRIDSFTAQDFAEFNFDHQAVMIGQAAVTGKIDKMHIEGRQVQVLDYKTGKAISKWGMGSDYEKLKSWKYKNQLIFYKLLVEKSRDFQGKYEMNTGILEFIEAKNPSERLLELYVNSEDSSKMSKLIEKVYEKIITLDFPDISRYEKNLYGILSFSEDLIEGRI